MAQIIPKQNFRLSDEQLKAWLNNLLKFTAPAICAFFAQLALGVTVEKALPFALIILWGLLADYFKKLK